MKEVKRISPIELITKYKDKKDAVAAHREWLLGGQYSFWNIYEDPTTLDLVLERG